jgi:hypothetical protein
MKNTYLSGVRTVVVAMGGLGALASVARAEGIEGAPETRSGFTLPSPTLSLDLAAALAWEPPPTSSAGGMEGAAGAKPDGEGRARGYGKSGSRWWTVGGVAANNFHQATDVNLHLSFSQFLADELEFGVEGAGWYFHQPGDDTGGLSASMVFRWHFKHAEDYRWTVFGEAGIGVLGAFDVVPEGGTGFDFLPRLGAGITWALGESVEGESRGSRIMVGVRYHHISNGRISGDGKNPARDGVAVYAALVVPF